MTKQHSPQPRFPVVVKNNGRGYLFRSHLDRYKAELLAQALGVKPVYPPPLQPDPLVPLPAAADELGVTRRTVGRRIAESQSAGEAA
jgi:hypothetical protein